MQTQNTMKAKITDTITVRKGSRTEIEYITYEVSSDAECKCDTSRSAYQTACEFGTYVRMGSVTVELV